MILERLKQYIDAKGITIAAFEREAGMSNAAFGKALKNNIKPQKNITFIKSISHVL